MQIWTPHWTIEPPAQTRGASGFGGVVTGLATEDWPVCGECGTTMTLLLRLAAGPWIPRLPAGHVLLVFKCESEDVCDFWEPDDVANRSVLVHEDQLAGDDSLPADVSESRTHVLPQVWVKEWVATDDGVTAEQAMHLDDPELFWDLPEEVQFFHGFDSSLLTKAGGAPNWTGNGPSDEPPSPRALLFQIDNWIGLVDEPEAVRTWSDAAGDGVVVRDNQVSAANFLSDGIAYIFDVTPDAPVPTPRMLIAR